MTKRKIITDQATNAFPMVFSAESMNRSSKYSHQATFHEIKGFKSKDTKGALLSKLMAFRLVLAVPYRLNRYNPMPLSSAILYFLNSLFTGLII